MRMAIFLPITIIADVDSKSPLAQHEVFGPVLAVTPFDTEEEAIALANGTTTASAPISIRRTCGARITSRASCEAGMIQVNGSGEGMHALRAVRRHEAERLWPSRRRSKGCTSSCSVKNVWMNLAKPAGCAQ